MPIKVRGYLTFKTIIGELSIPIPEGKIYSIHDLLHLLAEQIDEEFSAAIYDPQTNLLGDHVAVIINGRSYNNLPEGLETPLKDGDQVSIFPPMAGG